MASKSWHRLTHFLFFFSLMKTCVWRLTQFHFCARRSGLRFLRSTKVDSVDDSIKIGARKRWKTAESIRSAADDRQERDTSLILELWTFYVYGVRALVPRYSIAFCFFREQNLNNVNNEQDLHSSPWVDSINLFKLPLAGRFKFLTIRIGCGKFKNYSPLTTSSRF